MSPDEVQALKFAVHRQLATWSNKPKLSPPQHAQRTAGERQVSAAGSRGELFTRGTDNSTRRALVPEGLGAFAIDARQTRQHRTS